MESASDIIRIQNTKILEQITQGHKGSFSNNVYGAGSVQEAYASAISGEGRALAKYTSEYNEGRLTDKTAVDAAYCSGMAKAMSSRYASRKTLYKVGLDKKLATNFLVLTKATNFLVLTELS